MSDVWEENPPVKQPRISSLQLAILRRLQERGPLSPYNLGTGTGSLKSMARRNLVVAEQSKPVLWRITEEGCQLIQEQGK